MRKRGAAARMALCGVLAALAVALMFLGGTVPFASIACPVLASLVLIPVYCECGWKWGLLWYAAVAALAALLAPEKEAAVLFVFFGYYPMLRKLIGRLRVRAAAWAVKLVYVNAAVFAAYGLMLYVFHLTAVMEDFAGRNGVVALPWIPAALASSMASSMALLMTSGSMEYSSGIGFVTSMPPRRPSSCCVLKALARSSGVSIS